MFFLFSNKRKYIHAYVSLTLVFSVLFSSVPLFVYAQDEVQQEPPVEEGVVQEDAPQEVLVEEATQDDSSDQEDVVVEQTEGDGAVEEVAEEQAEGDDGSEDVADITVIETGEVVASTDVVYEINTTETDTSVSNAATTATSEAATVSEMEEESLDGEETETATETDTETEDVPQEGTESQETQGLSSPAVQQTVEVTSLSTADVEVEAEVDANSGDNDASGNENSLVVTGDVYAEANVVTMANTNIVNSDGFIMLLGTLYDSLDLRGLKYWEFLGDGEQVNSDSCDNSICGTSYTFVDTNNTADITNNVVVEANSGDNQTSNNTEGGVVLTGDAYASANVLNLVNTNIVNANYLVFSANHFGDLQGDLLFPASEDMMEFFYGGAGYSSTALVNTDNTADVENNVLTEANTGDNTASGNDSVIFTGDAQASTNVVDQVNRNYINSDQFLFVFRVHGSWGGSVLGLPEGLVWSRGAGGGIVSSNTSGNDDFGANTSNTYDVNATNAASVTNNVSVSANTGGNAAEDNDLSGIETGDAYAGANVINVVNTNILGRNWILAVVNIFGDWTGSVSFGQTDLWIAGQVDTGGKEYPEVTDEVTYHYTVINNSDTTAPDVRVVDAYDEHLRFVSSNSGGYKNGDTVVWDIGDLAPGGSVEVEYTALVYGSIPWAYTILENKATVSADMSDANYSDNTEIIHITGYRQPHTFYSGPVGELPEPTATDDTEDDVEEPATGSAGYVLTDMPVFSIVKTHNMPGIIHASTTVTYEVNIRNEGGEAYYALLLDTIKDQAGNVIYEQYWPLDTVYPNEEIVISYDVFYNSDTPNGMYINHAHIEAMGRHNSLESPLAVKIETESAVSMIIITESVEEAVPGAGDTIVPVDSGVIERDYPDRSLLINAADDDSGGGFGSSKLREHLGETIGKFGLFDDNIGLFGLSGLQDVRNVFKTQQEGADKDANPFGLGASVFEAFSNIWISRYSWIFLLMLLGTGLVVLLQRRDYA